MYIGTHELIKSVFSAADKRLCSANFSQVSRTVTSHFSKKSLRAAPVSFFSMAWRMHVACCASADGAKTITRVNGTKYRMSMDRRRPGVRKYASAPTGEPSGMGVTEGRLIYQIREGEPTRGIFLFDAMPGEGGSHLAFIFSPLLCHERAGLGTPCSYGVGDCHRAGAQAPMWRLQKMSIRKTFIAVLAMAVATAFSPIPELQAATFNPGSQVESSSLVQPIKAKKKSSKKKKGKKGKKGKKKGKGKGKSTCGTFMYKKGGKCVDARSKK
jgi:hypothetical protein